MHPTANVPPFPPSGAFLSSIRQTSRNLRQSANVLIEPQSIQRLLLSPSFISSYKTVSKSHGLALPLNFASVLAELNLLSILSLLNFGSGYRVPLHLAVDRGAWDTIRAFVFSLYLSSSVEDEGNLLSAKGMQSITENKIASLMNLSLHTERPHESIPGVTVGELGGPMYDLVQHVKKTLNETGDILVKTGYPDMGSFVLEALLEGEKAKSSLDADAEMNVVLERLVRAIPALQDMGIVDGQRKSSAFHLWKGRRNDEFFTTAIYCFKKALFLIHAVTVRFGSMSPPPFPIPSTNGSPIFADNVIPSLLIHFGVIDLSHASFSLPSVFQERSVERINSLLSELPGQHPATPKAKEIPKEGPILTADQSYILRASAIDACAMIVEAAHSLDDSVLSLAGDPASLAWMKNLTLPGLDMWIWSVAKLGKYKSLKRFVQRDTVFY